MPGHARTQEAWREARRSRLGIIIMMKDWDTVGREAGGQGFIDILIGEKYRNVFYSCEKKLNS